MTAFTTIPKASLEQLASAAQDALDWLESLREDERPLEICAFLKDAINLCAKDYASSVANGAPTQKPERQENAR